MSRERHNVTVGTFLLPPVKRSECIMIHYFRFDISDFVESNMADRAEIQAKIKDQGEIVRKLKAEKAAKEQVWKMILYIR